MEKVTKVFRNNRSQAVRLPKEFRLADGEVYIRRQGEELVLSVQPMDWSRLLASSGASEGFNLEVRN